MAVHRWKQVLSVKDVGAVPQPLRSVRFEGLDARLTESFCNRTAAASRASFFYAHRKPKCEKSVVQCRNTKGRVSALNDGFLHVRDAEGRVSTKVYTNPKTAVASKYPAHLHEPTLVIGALHPADFDS